MKRLFRWHRKETREETVRTREHEQLCINVRLWPIGCDISRLEAPGAVLMGNSVSAHPVSLLEVVAR